MPPIRFSLLFWANKKETNAKSKKKENPRTRRRIKKQTKIAHKTARSTRIMHKWRRPIWFYRSRRKSRKSNLAVFEILLNYRNYGDIASKCPNSSFLRFNRIHVYNLTNTCRIYIRLGKKKYIYIYICRRSSVLHIFLHHANGIAGTYVESYFVKSL